MVLSVEHLEITISGTATTGTADITLGQVSANCYLDVSFKSATGSGSAAVRLPEVYFSDTNTITAERNTGTDIGTITVLVEVVEFDDALCLVQQGTFSLGSGVVSDGIGITEVSAFANAFFTINYKTSYSATVPYRSAQIGAFMPDTVTIAVERNASSNTTAGRFFLVETLDTSLFSVQHGSFTLASSAETANQTLGEDQDLAKSFLITTQNSGHTGDDWRTGGVRSRLEDVAGALTVIVERANGGAASAQSAVIYYQAVTFGAEGNEAVQRGTLLITGTSDTDTLGTAIELDSATVHSPMVMGMGEGDSTDGLLIGANWCAMEITATDTVTGSVVTDITPNGLYSYEVIDWDVAGDAVIEATIVAQVEVLGGVAKTGVLQAEILQGIASTAVAQAEVLAGVQATAVAQAEVLQGVAATAIAQAEVLAGIERTAVLQAEVVSAAIEATLIAQVEVLGGVQAIAVLQAEALAGVQATAITQAEVLQGVAATAAVQAEVLQGVARTGVLQVEVASSAIEATLTAQVEVVQQVEAIRALQVESLRGIAASAVLQVEFLAGISRTLVAQVEALGEEPSESSDIVSGALDVFRIELMTDPITYFPGGIGSGLARRAVVERGIVRPLDFVSGRAIGHVVEFWIANDATIGVDDVIVGKDAVVLVLVEGEPPVRCLVTEIVASDAGAWHLLAQR